MVELRPLSDQYYQIKREAKTLYPFLRKLYERRSLKFGTLKAYMDEECSKLKNEKNINELWGHWVLFHFIS